MKTKTKDILENILYVSCAILLIVIGINTENSKILVMLFFGGIILLVFFGMYLYVKISDYKNKKVHDSIYKKIQEKGLKDNYDLFCELVYKGIADDTLKVFINKEKIKDVYDIEIDFIYSKKDIYLSYGYRGFYILFLIYGDKIIYTINTAEKYDYTPENIDFEKNKIKYLKINSYLTIDDYFYELSKQINEINKLIDEFVETTKIDPILDGTMINAVKLVKKNYRVEGLVCSILGPILAIIFGVFFFFLLNDKTYQQDNYAGYILCWILIPGFEILFIYATIYGINNLIKISLINIDLKEKHILTIREQPKKIRIKMEGKSKFCNVYRLKFIKLYFDNIVVLIPFINNENIKNKKKLKKCITSLININCDLKYLEKSKLVVAGSEEYKKMVKKILLK